jgi:hypothetical protein
VAGAGLYLLSTPAHRPWLGRTQPYAAAAITLLIFAPVLIWNATHGWTSFVFQGARAAVGGLRPWEPLRALAGEALFLAPWIWAPLIWRFLVALWRGPAEWRGWFCCCLGAPPILAFALVGLWSSRHVLFHWAAPGYLLLVPLLGADVAERLAAGSRTVRVWLTGGAAFVLIALALIGTEARWFWFPLPAQLIAPGSDIEAADWMDLRPQIAARGWAGEVVGTLRWEDAGRVDYALGGAVPVIVLSRDQRQFGLIRPADALVGRDVLILAPGHSAEIGKLAGRFESIEALPPFTIDHPGRPTATIAAYLGHGLRASATPPPSAFPCAGAALASPAPPAAASTSDISPARPSPCG